MFFGHKEMSEKLFFKISFDFLLSIIITDRHIH